MNALVSKGLAGFRTHPLYEQSQLNVRALPPAWGDRKLIQEIWHHVLDNAFKFLPDGAAPQLEIGGEEDWEECRYWVRDQGIGFNQQYQHKLFQLFQTLHPKGKYPGFGVGLAFVKRIILRHQGRIWAEGEEGKGASIIFCIPKKK